jgi:multicomponent Na+:H+ antiporter subunit E
MAVRMQLLDKEGFPIEIFLSFLAYLPWLLRELVKSGVEISMCVLNPRVNITPRIVKIKPSQKTPLGLMIYANSITLTPGTVSISVSNEEIEVHTLTDNAEKDLINGTMNHRVAAIEEIL